MADTTARTLRLLELLQSAQQRTVAELAERLGVHERTVRRDVARLVELGLPVETMRGRYGGYQLAPGRGVLPLMFSSEEAAAVLLGSARGQFSSPEPSIAAQTALAKITRALPVGELEKVGALAEMTTSTSHDEVSPDPGTMLTLAEAVHLGRVLDLRYTNRDGAPSRRMIRPFELVAHAGRWYLVAFDVDRQTERTFRVDRVRSVRPTGESFAPSRRPDGRGRLLDSFAEADHRWHVVLRIGASEEHIRKHLPRSVARLEALSGGEDLEPWFRAEIRAVDLDWLPAVIAALDCEVEIERPDELRELVRTSAERMLRAAEGGHVHC